MRACVRACVRNRGKKGRKGRKGTCCLRLAQYALGVVLGQTAVTLALLRILFSCLLKHTHIHPSHTSVTRALLRIFCSYLLNDQSCQCHCSTVQMSHEIYTKSRFLSEREKVRAREDRGEGEREIRVRTRMKPQLPSQSFATAISFRTCIGTLPSKGVSTTRAR